MNLTAATALKKARQRPEKAIQRAILDFLAKVPGVHVWKSGGGMFPMTYKGKARMVRMGKRGVSDLVGRRREPSSQLGFPYVARFVAIEVKRPGRPLNLEQSVFLDEVRLSGGLAIVAHNVEDVATALGLASPPGGR